jgi:hypothetical protein
MEKIDQLETTKSNIVIKARFLASEYDKLAFQQIIKN